MKVNPREPRMTDIIKRMERVRKFKNLSKQNFAGQMGMSGPSYNNFTGINASKPNMTLILEVCSKYSVDPGWLLFGWNRPWEGGPEL